VVLLEVVGVETEVPVELVDEESEGAHPTIRRVLAINTILTKRE
jgi:hypothetical protein